MRIQYISKNMEPVRAGQGSAEEMLCISRSSDRSAEMRSISRSSDRSAETCAIAQIVTKLRETAQAASDTDPVTVNVAMEHIAHILEDITMIDGACSDIMKLLI